jgi:hypothetical protein
MKDLKMRKHYLTVGLIIFCTISFQKSALAEVVNIGAISLSEFKTRYPGGIGEKNVSINFDQGGTVIGDGSYDGTTHVLTILNFPSLHLY